jgi:hemerythrin-like metal-binding protein
MSATPEIAWSDELLTDQPQMDATHRAFVEHLARVEAALGQPDAVLLPCYDALVAHTVEHFAHEDRWMAALGFAPENCHSSQHTQVLAVLKDVRRQHVENPRTDLIGRLLPELMHWFTQHAQAADAGLAGAMAEAGYDALAGEVAPAPTADLGR